MQFILDNGIICYTLEQAVSRMQEQRMLKGKEIQCFKDVTLPMYHKHYMEALRKRKAFLHVQDRARRYEAMADLWASLNVTYSKLSNAITAYRKLRIEFEALGREIRKYEKIMEPPAVRGRQV